MTNELLSNYLNVHWPVYQSDYRFPLAAIVLVTLFHRFRLPVGPVDVIFEDGHGENMVQPSVGIVASAEHNARITTFQIGDCDVILACIRPEQFICLVRNGQRVRPT